MAKVEGRNLTPATAGSVLHEVTRYYKVMARLMMLSREREFQ